MLPLNVEFLSEELPVLALGVGSVEGGADALPNGRRDFEGFGACLGGDRAVGLHKKWEHLLFLLEKKTTTKYQKASQTSS